MQVPKVSGSQGISLPIPISVHFWVSLGSRSAGRSLVHNSSRHRDHKRESAMDTPRSTTAYNEQGTPKLEK